jgi:hypothetical protein
MASHYYIYYRVAAPEAAACANSIKQLFARIEKDHGVRGKLLHKHGEALLWMEVYENVPDAERFNDALAAVASGLGFDRHLQPGAGRRVERFDD